MRKYEFDDDDEKAQEELNAFEDSDGQEQYMDMMNAGFAQRDLDQQLLAMAIQVSQGSFWWRFKGFQSRMQTIYQNYTALASLLVGEDEEKDEPGS